ncbi:TetR/AcrR family transcriptional regulator [Streptomyces sp. NA04227]|uniref:TetR/AcrR family transcriptional regulator n=1 Tax=Streptomyces sp. NA04227 TaxID=2742136 RepID=UPI0015900224|nr:TetR/AcrR family transcriptional regulator [Streptomyces sp. NA04227]QKW08438.1 TetR/AcrR family transcriptional regulator [Streptomyces sp. NA04227]
MPQERSAEIIARIVHAAGVVFDREGFQSATTLRIQTLAGVSRGAFHHHFRTKRDLGDAVVARQTAFFAEAEAQGPANGLYTQALVDLSYRHCTALLTDPVIRASARLATEPGPYRCATSFRAPIDATVALLDAAREAGELIPGRNTFRIARCLTAWHTGTQILADAITRQHDLHDQVHAMWELSLPGIVLPGVLARLCLQPPPVNAQTVDERILLPVR